MSYKHLAGRLIETQRSMLGKSALKIARSVEGIDVDDDGSVAAVTGDSRAVVETLSQRYIEMLGSAAENRLLAAAREFEDDLILPPSLGGPDDYADVAADRRTREPTSVDDPDADPAATPSAGALSDGGTVSVQSASGTDEPTEVGGADQTPEARHADEALREVASIPEPVKVDYTVASSIPATPDLGTELGSIYLMPLDGDGWQTPVSVADAVADALSEATEHSGDGVDALVEDIDTGRLLATLNGENGETASFHLEDVTVTFHRTGSLAIH